MTGSRSERGFSYVLSTSSILSMYSSSNFPTHHIFFPPRLEVVAFQQHPDGLPADVRNQFALDHFFGQQPHRPTCPPLRRRRAASNTARSSPPSRYRLPICHTALAESPRLAPTAGVDCP